MAKLSVVPDEMEKGWGAAAQWLTQGNPSKCRNVLLSLATDMEEPLIPMITCIFLVAMVRKNWYWLPREAFEPPSLQGFRKHADGVFKGVV